jgi:nucleoside phosphorylase
LSEVLKSICDYADNEKSDQYQRFAAFTSTRLAEYLLQEELDFE